MAGPRELLAKSLRLLEARHKANQYVFAASHLSPAHLNRLKTNGYLGPIMRGWYVTTRPEDQRGDTTPWRAYWREFISRYAVTLRGALASQPGMVAR